jgi:gliding motility-associated-like protein
VINTATNTVIATIPVGALPYSLGNFIASSAGCTGMPITFTITVNPANASNVKLSSLKLSTGTLSPDFSSDSTSYTATVINAITSVKVTPTASDPSSTVTVNGIITKSGMPSASIPLVVGPNIITTVVTLDSASTTYTITVTRKASDYAYLADLQLSSGKLKPAFVKTTFDYAARVSRTTFEITVTPIAGNNFETIKVDSMVVVSGTASSPIALSDGINNITIVVTSQNGTNIKTYSLAVTKEPFEPNSVGENNGTNDEELTGDEIKVHQGVSPNGDGVNDVLVIDNITAYPENKLSIISRSGVLVFETLGYNNSSRVFDGHSNQNGAMQAPGTYFYSLEYKVGEATKYQTGYIILKY